MFNSGLSPFASQAFSTRSVALLLGAAAFQFVVLVGMIAVDASPLLFGETLRLKVQPVDPRDLFRGDYVVLGYDFTNVQPVSGGATSSWGYDYWEQVGREVYVVLKPSPDGEYYVTDKVSGERPASGPYLKGKITGYHRISCGIEAYYVQEGEGRALEQAIRDRKNVFVDVAVLNGTARLKDVIVE